MCTIDNMIRLKTYITVIFTSLNFTDINYNNIWCNVYLLRYITIYDITKRVQFVLISRNTVVYFSRNNLDIYLVPLASPIQFDIALPVGLIFKISVQKFQLFPNLAAIFGF